MILRLIDIFLKQLEKIYESKIMSEPMYSDLELEAAQGLIHLTKSIDEMIVANTLVHLSQQQADGMMDATRTLMDINQVKVSDAEKHELSELLKTKPFNLIKKNVKTLENYGLYPPVKFLNDTSGGERTLRVPVKTKGQEGLNKAEEFNRKFAEKATKSRIEKLQVTRENKLREQRAKYVGKVSGPYETLPSVFKNLLGNLCDINGASKFMRQMFPTEVVSEWKDVLGKNCRAIYEIASIEKQCMVVLEKTNKPAQARDNVYANKRCYLCGFHFQNADGLKPSCEHILPIIQAIFLLDLWRPYYKYTAAELKVLEFEYDWAHTCCNLSKGAKPYLNTIIDKNDPYPRWEFNYEGTYDILRDLIEDNNNYVGMNIIRKKLLTLFKTQKKEDWITNNVNRIKTTKIKPIVDYINSKGHGGDVAIIGFNNCLDPRKISNEFHDILQEHKERTIRPESPATVVYSPAYPIQDSRSPSPFSLTGMGRKRKTFRRLKNYNKTRKNRIYK